MEKKSTQGKVYEKAIKHWPKDERPREKLFREGEHKLSNTELLAILLRSGVKGQSAIDLARKIVQKFKTFRNMSHTDIRDWKEFKGLGDAKIAQVRAAMEIARRFGEEKIEDRLKIESSKDVYEIMLLRMRDLKKEVFKILMLNSQNRITDVFEIVQGSVNQASPIVREIFQKAAQKEAVSIICVHNHPSGDPYPSKEDEAFTQELIQAGKVLQTKVLDHIIIGDNSYYSFTDKGKIAAQCSKE